MKLTTLYYRHIVPAVMVLFVAVIVSAYFLIRHALQRELDLGLSRSKRRIEAYVKTHGKLPEVNSFDDQHVVFAPLAAGTSWIAGYSAANPDSFANTMVFIPEQNKMHISRKLSFPIVLKGQG